MKTHYTPAGQVKGDRGKVGGFDREEPNVV